MAKRWRTRAYRSGSATALVMVAVVILLALGTGLLSLGYNSNILSIRTATDIRARCAADAGLTKALYEMNQLLDTKPWNDELLPAASEVSVPGCDATFSYTVTKAPDSVYTIEATGNAGINERTVNAALQIKGPFDYAILGIDEVELNNNSSVDGYNFAEGDDGLQVGTLSTSSNKIELKNGCEIDGDVVVGVGGDPDAVIKDQGADITGQTYAMTRVPDLPAITVPAWLAALPSRGDIDGSDTIDMSGKYGQIDLGNGDTIEVTGPVIVYVTGDITLDNSAQLKVSNSNPDASLILYLAGDFEGKNGGSINNATANPKKLKIYGLNSCHDMRFKNGCNLYAAIYAPEAEITFDNSADAYGAVVGKEFEQKNSASFHYDASLREASTDDEATTFAVARWSE